jgi:hypothetical protein
MAVFSAIASAIVGSIFTAGTILGSTLLYAAAVGVVAAGLGFATAKLLGVFDPPDLGPDPGVKIQVAPSTDNKIGVAFGRNFMSGPITDVAITNSNDTMNYCITLSEYLEGATYTVNNIFWGDTRLNFSGANVISQFDPNATTTTDWKNKIRMRLYAGSTASANQVFPTSGAVDATTMMRHWTNTTAYSMEDLVFLMVEVDYDAENGLTGLGALSVDMSVNIDNPGEVLQRYLNNPVWGAGLANTFIDTTSIIGTANTAMKGYCDEQISFTNNAGAGATIDRWQTNGYLNTNRTVLENIDRICRNANTFFTFDGKQGKFKAVPNRALSSTELASCFVLNDDNIVSKIGVQSTELYSLFNSVKVEFADQNRKDQTNTVIVTTPAGDRNPGEQDNELNFRSELVNNNVHSTALANIDLVQSRNGMVIQLDGDYSTLQIDAGDVIKLTNSVYGFTNKLFRVMLNKEKLTPDGMITCELTLLEYNAGIYDVPAITETPEEDDPIDIPIIPPIPPIIPPGYLKNLFFNVTQTGTSGSGVNGNFIVRANTSFPFAYEQVFVTNGGTGYANADVITVTGNTLRGQTPANDLTFQVNGVNGSGTIPTVLNATQNITGNANLRANTSNYGGIIDKDMIADFGAGGQVDTAPAANTTLTANTAVFANIAPTVPIDLANIENGKYTVLTNATPLGQLPGTGVADYGIRFGIDVDFANNQTITNFVSQGVGLQNFDHIPSVINSQGEFEVTDEMIGANIRLEGFNTLADVGGTPNTVGFKNMKYDMFRLNKGELE